jgi:valyl-tRNA synthetase
LLDTLETLLRILHPLMPFITEEIWQRLIVLKEKEHKTPSLMLARWPSPDDLPHDPAAEADIEWIKTIVLGIRQIRGEMDISPSRGLDALLEGATPADLARAQEHATYLGRLAGLNSLRALAPEETPPPAAAAVIGNLRILVPMQGLIDPQAEIDRLTKRLQKIGAEIAKAQAKLANDNFVRNAPVEVVQQEKDRLQEFTATEHSLREQLSRVRELG